MVAPPRNSEAPTQFVQTGTSLLTDPPGSTLRIQLPAAGGTATFANLDGPGANVVLGLGTGTATGTMEVGGLLVLGQVGSADLFGSVAGVTTQAAAALGRIVPAINANYTFNDCVIGLRRLRGTHATADPADIPGSARRELELFPAAAPARPCRRYLHCRRWSLVVLETPPLLTGELTPQDVVPPNISFEDY